MRHSAAEIIRDRIGVNKEMGQRRVITGHTVHHLEANAREFARRFMNTSGDDIERIRDALGTGAQKLQDYLQRYGSQYVWYSHSLQGALYRRINYLVGVNSNFLCCKSANAVLRRNGSDYLQRRPFCLVLIIKITETQVGLFLCINLRFEVEILLTGLRQVPTWRRTAA